MDVIAVQAREHGLLVREELGYMIIHGFLHLLGYDHEKSPGAAEKMFNIQDQLFEKLLASRAHSR
jgi:probable rRNA maturation factor